MIFFHVPSSFCSRKNKRGNKFSSKNNDQGWTPVWDLHLFIIIIVVSLEKAAVHK